MRSDVSEYRYSSFRELKREKRRGVHYSIWSRDRGSRVLIMAPHGGRIEPYTAELARKIASQDFSLYAFVGRQGQNNLFDLHVQSHLYDEECAQRMAAAAEVVFAVHGQDDRAEFLMPGGLHTELRRDLAEAWSECGFDVRDAQPGLGGEHERNICNAGRLHAGVQVEISSALRGRLRSDVDLGARFVEATRAVLSAFESGNST